MQGGGGQRDAEKGRKGEGQRKKGDDREEEKERSEVVE